MVEAGIIKFKLLEGLPRAEICPQNLGSIERQLKNGDLMTTYYIVMTGFSTGTVVFLTELIFKCLTNRQLWRPSGKKQALHQMQIPIRLPYANKNFGNTPPPPYTTLFSRHNNAIEPEWPFRNINGRGYMVVKERKLDENSIPTVALKLKNNPNNYLYMT